MSKKILDQLQEAKYVYFETDNGLRLCGEISLSKLNRDLTPDGVFYGVTAELHRLREIRETKKAKK